MEGLSETSVEKEESVEGVFNLMSEVVETCTNLSLKDQDIKCVNTKTNENLTQETNKQTSNIKEKFVEKQNESDLEEIVGDIFNKSENCMREICEASSRLMEGIMPNFEEEDLLQKVNVNEPVSLGENPLKTKEISSCTMLEQHLKSIDQDYVPSENCFDNSFIMEKNSLESKHMHSVLGEKGSVCINQTDFNEAVILDNTNALEGKDDVSSKLNAKGMSLRNKKYSLAEKIDDNTATVIENEQKMKEMMSPYNWEECMTFFDNKDFVARLLTKLSDPESIDFWMYPLKIILACIYGHRKEEGKAFEIFEAIEANLVDKSKDPFFSDIKDGLLHIVNASKLYLNHKIGDVENASAIASATTKFKDLSKASRAAVWAVKAYILCEFDNDAKVKALDYAKRALDLDPDANRIRRGAWYYLTGKIYTEIREGITKNKLPGVEELKMFEKSLENNPFPNHLAVVTDKYTEAANVYSQRLSYNRRMFKKYKSLSHSFYMKCMEHKELSNWIIKRCRSELLKQPLRFLKKEREIQTLKKVLELIKVRIDELSQEVNHKCVPVDGDDSFRKSNQEEFMNAAIVQIKINCVLDEDYIPLEDCDKYIGILQKFPQSTNCKESMAFFMIVKGECYFYRKRDLFEAAREWRKAIRAAPNSVNLLRYERQLTIRRVTLNIYELLKEKLKFALKSRRYSQNKKFQLEEILRECQNKNI